MCTHLVWDIETLGLYEDAVILSVAVVPFDFEHPLMFKKYIENGFTIKLSVEDQVKNYGRKVSKETVEWWKQQDEEAKKMALLPSVNDLTLEEGCEALTTFIKSTEYTFAKSYSWSRGVDFDFPKINSIFRQTEIRLPYNARMVRDIRTFIDIFAGRNDGRYEVKQLGCSTNEFVAHNCLHDAAMDVMRLTELFYEANDDTSF